jgi:hypothetical protein
MKNLFIQNIREGKIRGLDDLKSAYRQIVMRTHPDAVGSDRLVEEYIEYSNFYEEAKALILQAGARTATLLPVENENYRFLFYREFFRLERIDKPYAFNWQSSARRDIEQTKQNAFMYFSKWNPDLADLYIQANKYYDKIKLEKPAGPYMKYALLYNLSPVFHNILAYQLTGLKLYKLQLKQNLPAIMSKLDERQFRELKDYINLLISDMDNKPAIQEST